MDDKQPDAVAAEFQNEMLTDLNDGFGKIAPEILSAKMSEQEILKESAENGGPTSTLDALNILMDVGKIGYRRLSAETGVRRRLLQDMLAGKAQVTPEVFSKIYELSKRQRPDLFKGL